MKKTKKQGKRKKVRISENLQNRNKVKKLKKKAGKKEIAEKEESKNSRNVKMEKLQTNEMKKRKNGYCKITEKKNKKKNS